MRLPHFPLILPLPFKQPIKSLLGNMTHVLRPFQPLYYPNKQLLFAHAQLDS